MAKACPYCATLIGKTQGLCSTCHMGIAKYPDQNQVIIDAYVRQGFVQLEAFLEHHAAFHTWLINHGGSP